MQKKDLRIVFMGTPEFAVPTLKAMVEQGYNVVAVVTQPDKPVGRHGSVLQASAVKQYAQSVGLPVLQPLKMKDPAFVEQLQSYQANLQVVVAFRMLPEVVWAMPEYGTFNVHAALLPQYRGAAPINWAIIHGEQQTGVSTFFLDHDIDTGRVIMQKSFNIPQDADVEYVYDGLMALGADICMETIERIIAADGYPESIPQDQLMTAGQELRPAPKLFKENCCIDWNADAEKVRNFVRGLSPVPGAWTTLVAPDGHETVLKIYKAHVICCENVSSAIGTIVKVSRNMTAVVAGKKTLLAIDELQLAGKKRMNITDFMNGIKEIENYFVK